MSTLPDLTACSLIPPPYRGALRRRLEIANALVRTVSRRHRTVLLDAWADPRTRRHGMWSIDRIHPSADGHRLIAASVMQLLGLPVDETVTRPPDHEPVGRPPPPQRRGEVARHARSTSNGPASRGERVSG
jgi:hypothetical protein